MLDRLGRELDLPFDPAFADRPMSKTWGDMKVEAALAVLAQIIAYGNDPKRTGTAERSDLTTGRTVSNGQDPTSRSTIIRKLETRP